MVLELATQRVKLPSGKETSPFEALRFCYDLSETDVEILLRLLAGGKYDTETLARELGISKATINRSLNKLVSIGFVARERESRKSAGRPRYLYYVPNPKEIIARLERDLEICIREFRDKLKTVIEKATGAQG